MMDEDAEMEEADNTRKIAASTSFNSNHANAGGGGSIASGSFNRSGSLGSNISATAAGDDSSRNNDGSNAAAALPKWKRRVNLPSHSSLY